MVGARALHTPTVVRVSVVGTQICRDGATMKGLNEERFRSQFAVGLMLRDNIHVYWWKCFEIFSSWGINTRSNFLEGTEIHQNFER